MNIPKGKKAWLLVAAVLAVALLATHTGGLSSLAVPNANCAYIGINASAICSPIVNGTITSLSNVQIKSNFPGLNGQVWLVNFVTNGGGQGLFGTTAQQVASLFGGSASPTPIAIGTRLNSQLLAFPYTFSGTYVRQLSISQFIFNYNYSSSCPLFNSCSQVAESSSHPYYVLSSSSNAWFQSAIQGYYNTCTQQGGKMFVNLSVVGFQCINVTSTNIYTVYQSGSPGVYTNLSVTFNNGTIPKTLYLSTITPQASYQNILSTQIYGYQVGGLNTYIGTTSPTMLVNPSSGNGPFFIQPQTTLSINQLNQISSSCFQPYAVPSQTVTVYTLSTLQGCITQQNNNVQGLAQNFIQPTSPFAHMLPIYQYALRNFGGAPAFNNGAPFFGVLNVTYNPVFYPLSQMIVSAQTLGITIPVAYPKITGYSPKPLYIQSGSQGTETFTVYNNATVAGAAYLVITSNNGSVITQTPNFNVPQQGQAQQSVNIGGYNPDQANLVTQFQATVYSSQMNSISNTIYFPVIIRPNCNSGSTYVNNTNCVGNQNCASGYIWNGQACVNICTPPSVWNATTSTCYAPGTGAINNNILYYLIIAALIIAVLYLILSRGKGRGRTARRLSSFGNIKFDNKMLYVIIALAVFAYLDLTNQLGSLVFYAIILGVLFIAYKVLTGGLIGKLI